MVSNLSGYQPGPVEYSREPEPRAVERKQPDPREDTRRVESRAVENKQAEQNQPTPEELRNQSVANKPKAVMPELGSRIDIRA